MDRLSGMRVFRRVVERGGFSAAAQDLNMSVAATSKHVARLEEDLGARLLNRTTRRIAMTEVGRVYFDRIVRILDDIDETETAVSALHAAPRGRLRVNAPMSFGISHLGPALADFARANPEVELDVMLNDRFVDVIEEGFDVAVRITTGLPDSSLIARPICAIRIAVCATPDYVERHGMPEDPRRLHEHPALVYTLRVNPETLTLIGPEGTVQARLNPTVRTNNAELQRDILLTGLGIAALPTFVVGPDIAAGRLVPILPGWRAEAHTLYAIYPHARHLTPKVRAFVDHLVARFGPEPRWDQNIGGAG